MGYYIKGSENPDSCSETDYFGIDSELRLYIDFNSTDEKYLLQKSIEIGILFQRIQDEIDNLNKCIGELIKKQTNGSKLELENDDLKKIVDRLTAAQKKQKDIKLIKDFLDSKIYTD